MSIVKDSLMEEQEDQFDDFAGDEILDEKDMTYSYSPTFWQRIRSLFFMFPGEKRAEQYQRLRDLTDAIEQFPETAVNYLLRGELHIEMKQYDLAQADLEAALELAQAQFENERWGLTAQSTMDRAEQGLQRLMEL